MPCAGLKFRPDRWLIKMHWRKPCIMSNSWTHFASAPAALFGAIFVLNISTVKLKCLSAARSRNVGAIVVIGAGAIGSYLAARLHEARRDVLLIARGRRLTTIDRDGLFIADDRGLRRVKVPVAGQCLPGAVPSHVVVATKTFQLPEALALLDVYEGAQFGLLTVQNGVEAPSEAQVALPHARVLGGRMHGFFEMRDGILHHAGVPASLVMGSLASPAEPGAPDRETAVFEKALRDAEIETTLVPDVRPALWAKFLMASTVGAVAPAYGVTVGQISGHRDAWNLLRRAMEEVVASATAFGVALPADCVTATLGFVGAFPPDVTSSLQRDLEAHRPSEFAHLTGAIPRFAQQAGVAAPAAAKIIKMLRVRGLLPD